MKDYYFVENLNLSKKTTAEEYHKFCREHGINSGEEYKEYLIKTLLKDTKGFEVEFYVQIVEAEE